MPILLLILETFFLVKLYKKYKFSNCFTLVYFIVYFYCNAILFDLYLFSNEAVLSQFFVKIDPHSPAFSLTFFAYFLFLFTFFLSAYFGKLPEGGDDISNGKRYNFTINNFVLILLSGLLLLLTWRNTQLTRDVMLEEGIFWRLIDVFLYMFFVLTVFYTKGRALIGRILFYVCFLVYCVYSYDRALFVLLLATILISLNNKIRLWQLAAGGVLFLLVITFYKAFYALFLGGHGWYSFSEFVVTKQISLAALDPYASFSLIYDYFDKTPFYLSEHTFSYFTSWWDQFNRYVNNADVLSMGQAVSKKYVHDEFGLAYSMILESILNFSIFGPVVLAIAAKGVYVFLYKKFYRIRKLIDVLFVVFFVAFVRTELMVMVKAYIIPIGLFLFLLSLRINRGNVNQAYRTPKC